MAKPKFELSKEKRTEMVQQIMEYYKKQCDEPIGDLAAMLLLDFFIDKMAPAFYNQGIADAHKYVSERLDDLFSIQKY